MNIWLQHLLEVHNNRQRGAAKAAETRKKRCTNSCRLALHHLPPWSGSVECVKENIRKRQILKKTGLDVIIVIVGSTGNVLT